MKKLIGFILIAGAVLAFSSCCSCRNLSASGGQLEGGTWQLVQIEGRSINAANNSYTLNFSTDNRVTGVGDCNRLTGSFSNDKSNGILTFGAMAATRMMCPNQVQEDLFVKTLGVINSYKVDGNKMLLLFANGELKMILEKKN